VNTTKKTPASNLTPVDKKIVVSSKPAATNHTPSGDFKPSDTSVLVAGDRVEHLKFGFGTVKEVEVNGSDRKAKILFEGGIGEKVLLLSFAKLRILEK
jgi:DNA helicase-2/ATP-dependent DNA helicase PcrA